MEDMFGYMLPTPEVDQATAFTPVQPEEVTSGVTTTSPVTVEQAQIRGAKYTFGLRNDPEAPTASEMTSSILTGQEGVQRDAAASRQALKDVQLRQQVLNDFITKRGGYDKITQEESDYIMHLTDSQMMNLSTPSVASRVPGIAVGEPMDPKSYFEKRFAEQSTNTFATLMDASTMDLAFKSEGYNQRVDLAQETIQRSEGYARIQEEVHAKLKEQGYLTTATSFVEQFMPQMSWWRVTQAIQQEQGVSPFMKGAAIENAIANINILPPEQAVAEAKRIVDTLAEQNIFDAIAFAGALSNFTSNDKLLENFNTIVDTGTLAVAAPLAVAKISGTVPAWKGLTRALGGGLPDAVRAAEAAGNDAKATAANLWARLQNKADMAGVPRSFDDMRNTTMTLQDVGAALKTGTPKTAREAVDRIELALTQDQVKLLTAIDTASPIQRLEAEGQALATATAIAKEKFHATYPDLVDPVLDVRTVYNPLTQTHAVEASIGKEVKGLPPVKDGYVRIYHGGSKDTTPGGGEWVSTDRAYAEGYAAKNSGDNAQVWYKDVPTSDPRVNNPDWADQGLAQGFSFSFQTKPGEKLSKLAPEGRATRIDYVHDTSAAPVTSFTTANGKVHELRGSSGAEDMVVQTRTLGEGSIPARNNETTYFIYPDDMTRLDPYLGKSGYRIAPTGNADEIGVYSTKAIKGTPKGSLIERIVAGSTPREGLNALTVGRKGRLFENNGVIKSVLSEGLGPVNKIDRLEIQLGTPKVERMGSEQEAHLYAKVYRLNPASYTVRQEGTGWSIVISTPVDESLPSVAAAYKADMKNIGLPDKGALGWALTLGRKYNTLLADRLFSQGLNAERKNTMWGAQVLQSAVKDIAEARIYSLKPAEGDRLTKFTKLERDFIDPTTKLKGRYSESQATFEQRWEDNFKMLPSEGESLAYWSSVQLNDMDLAINSLNVFRDKSAHLGLQNFGFKTKRWGYGQVNMEGKLLEKSYSADGKLIDAIPQDPRYGAGTIGVWDEAEGVVNSNRMGSLTRKDILEYQQNGYRVVRLSPEGTKAMKEHIIFVANKEHAFAKEDFNYMLVKDWQTAPLSINQIPYHAGGHVMYADEFFIKQPTIHVAANAQGTVRQHSYSGDKALHSLTTQSDAAYFQPRYEAARKLLNDDAALAQYLPGNLPYSVSDFKALFGGKDGYDPNVPFYITKRGQSVGEAHDLKGQYANLVNASDSPHNAYAGNVTMRYAQERGVGLTSIQRSGTEQHPTFAIVPARVEDPISAVSRITESLARSRYFDNLKARSVNEFEARFGDLVQKNGPFGYFNDPMNHLYSPKWVEGTPDLERLAAAKMFRRSSLELMGMRDPDIKSLDMARQSVTNTVMKRYGVESANWIDKSAIWREKNPVKVARMAALQLSQGFFNLGAFMQQAAQVVTASSMGSLNPANIYKNLKDATLLGYLKYNSSDAVVRHYAKIAGDSHFNESFYELARSGIMNGYRDHITAGEYFDMKPIQTRTGKFLDAGLGFSRKGDELSKLVAWSSAYNEWRRANPTAKITDNIVTNIIKPRMDVLNGNMSKASAAQWQSGVMAVPGQFIGWHARFAEQMLGLNKALSAGDRGRLAFVNGLMYGVPTTAAGAIFFAPVKDMLSKYFVENGIKPENNVVSDTLVNGLVSAFINATTGQSYDIGGSLGPGGARTMHEIFFGGSGDPKSALETFAGASGKAMLKLWDPLGKKILEATMGQVEGGFKTADFIEIINATAAGKNYIKAYGVINTGKFWGNQQQNQADVAGWTGLLAGMGFRPTDVNRMGTMLDINSDNNKALMAYKQQYQKNIRYGIEANANGQKADGDAYFRRAAAAIAASGARPDQTARWHKEVMDMNTSQYERARTRFMTQTPQRFEDYKNR